MYIYIYIHRCTYIYIYIIYKYIYIDRYVIISYIHTSQPAKQNTGSFRFFAMPIPSTSRKSLRQPAPSAVMKRRRKKRKMKKAGQACNLWIFLSEYGEIQKGTHIYIYIYIYIYIDLRGGAQFVNAKLVNRKLQFHYGI